MSLYRLRIHDDTGPEPREWVYEGVWVSRGPLEITSTLKDDGTIEVGSVELKVLAGRFAGSEDVFAMPDRYQDPSPKAGERVRYRALVEEYAEQDEQMVGVPVFDGTITKTGVSTDPGDDRGQREWTVLVEATALSDVMTKLGETNIYDRELLAAYDTGSRYGFQLWSRVETAWPGHRDTTDEQMGSESLRWYPVPEMWRVIIETLPGIEYERDEEGRRKTITLFPRPGDGEPARPHVISLESLYLGEDDEYFFEHTLPIWTAKRLLELIQSVTGLRLGARYLPYPSRVVEIEEIEGAWGEPGIALPALEGRAADDVYDLTTEEPNKNDFALWYDGEGDDRIGSYATYNLRPFRGQGQSRSPSNESVQSAPVLLANHSDVAVSERNDGAQYDPYVGVPQVEDEGAFMSAFETTSDLVEPIRAMAYRALPGDPPELRNEIWMVEHLHRHPLASAMLHQAVGTFDVEDLSLGVGKLQRGFALEGRGWLLREIRHNRETDAAKLQGVRVTRGYDPTPPQGVYFSRPVAFEAERDDFANELRIKVFWRKPSQTLTPRHYVLEVLDENGDILIDNFNGEEVRFRMRDTPNSEESHFVASPSGLNFTQGKVNFFVNDGTEESPDYTLRLRAEYQGAGGWTSDWVSIPFPSL